MVSAVCDLSTANRKPAATNAKLCLFQACPRGNTYNSTVVVPDDKSTHILAHTQRERDTRNKLERKNYIKK